MVLQLKTVGGGVDIAEVESFGRAPSRKIYLLGGTLCASHMADDRILACCGCRREVQRAEMVETIVPGGVPTEISERDNLESAREYGNHTSSRKYGKTATGVAMGRPIVLLVIQV